MLRKKLNFIFFPFLILGISFIGIYNFLYWLVFLKLELFSVKEEVLQLALPFILLGVAAFIWLKPRIKLLEFNSKHERTNWQKEYFYLIAAVMAILIPNMMTQKYLTKASGKLMTLADISGIENQEKSRYYSVEQYYVSKNDAGTHTSMEWNDKDLAVTLFVALPIYNSFTESFSQNASAWLGIKYSIELPSYLSEERKQKKYEDFIDKSQEDFSNRDDQSFFYLERIGSSNKLDGYEKALQSSSKFNSSNHIVLVPIDTPFEARNQGAFGNILLAYWIGAFIWLVMLLFLKIDEERLKTFIYASNGIRSNRKEYLDIFIPQKNYFTTPLLIDLNIIIFLFMLFSGADLTSMNTENLLHWGANYGPYIKEGEYWRLLTSIFLHGGIIHLAGNMWALFYIGTHLETFLGRYKFAFAYLTTGILASLASFYWSGGVSVGASGAVLGLCGVGLVYFYMTNVLPKEEKSTFLSVLGIIAAASLMQGFVSPNTDNVAHLGGFFSGCFIGLFIEKFGKNPVVEVWIERDEACDIHKRV
ncbi:MAG TPA: rhomboid family intramembrane serine protease [Parachlamydiaceae bacterium]|nr:rhomboid family intramembrane serine protease [Parachlamydiaceae bacterium]